ncbi:MAG: hypothetical protein ABI867_07200 [Kofleriaceae bacterium]
MIVASERGPQGVRLVAIDEHGDRRFELVAPTRVTTRDSNPTISPDGRWMVFASTRDRTLDSTSLWIVALGVEAPPRRLTNLGIDSHPIWMPDGRAIVFASTRAGGDFDLWRLAIDPRGAPGAIVQLTSSPDHEIQPTVAPDGTIAYAAVHPLGPHEVESRIEERAIDGSVRSLTSGPADSSPAYSPDGRSLVFARPAEHAGKAHGELWRIARSRSAVVQRLIALPLTDESGPVWSPDGRFVFATSVLRTDDGRVLFSSVVHVDLQEPTLRARILGDRAGAVARLTPAVRARRLDVAALHADPEYLPELARIMTVKINEQIQREAGTR